MLDSLRDKLSQRYALLGGLRFRAAKDGVGNFQRSSHPFHGPIFMGHGSNAALRHELQTCQAPGAPSVGAERGGVRLHQAEFAGVFATEEEIQVAVAAGIPVRPSMRPVRPSEIASVITENLHGARLARLLSRIKNELRAAIGSGGGFREGGIRFLFPALHLTAGLDKT